MPHDRGHLLWTRPKVRPTVCCHIDRVGAVLTDDGIDMPRGRADAQRRAARSEGLVAERVAVDHLLQIWAPEVRIVARATAVRSATATKSGVSRPRRRAADRRTFVLNLLGQLSGIATSARAWATLLRDRWPHQETVYGLLAKWAVHLGGCPTHRLNRQDG